MTKAVTFNNLAEAEAVMGPLFAARRVTGWTSANTFGKTTVRYQIGGAWFSLRQIDLVNLAG